MYNIRCLSIVSSDVYLLAYVLAVTDIPSYSALMHHIIKSLSI